MASVSLVFLSMDIDINDPRHPSKLIWADACPISHRQLLCISRIILNWGKIDTLLCTALAFTFKVDPEDRGLLLYVLDIRKKCNLIEKKVKGTPLEKDTKIIVKELFFCLQNYKYHRDVIAHGTIAWNQQGKSSFFDPKTLNEFSLELLPVILKRSRYTLKVTDSLVKLLGGLVPPALPSRPD